MRPALWSLAACLLGPVVALLVSLIHWRRIHSYDRANSYRCD